jgi:hypothetical protein
MPFPNIELPADFELPRLREPKPRDKRWDNLRPGGPGRAKGLQNKICRDLKEGLIDAAIAHGADGLGAGGLHGYLFLLASEHRKTFAGLLCKLLPLNMTANVEKSLINEVRIISVPSGVHLSPEQMARAQAGEPYTIDAVTTRSQEPEEPIAHEIVPQSPEEARLLAELDAMTDEQLMDRAVECGWTRSEFAKFIIEHDRRLIKALYEHGFGSDEPEPRSSHPEPPEPEPPRKAKFTPGTQAWFHQLEPTQHHGVEMNSIARSVPRPRPPRRPSWDR